jgi:putative DNA primase/helicase
LLESCTVHLRPIVFTALNTGMSRGEILNLKWEQVDLKNGFIFLGPLHTKSGKRPFGTMMAEVAQRRGVCILTVTHLNKGSGSALHRVIGSIAFTAAARVAFIVGKDDKDPMGERRLFLPIKNNLGDDRTGLSYMTEKVRLPSGIETVKIIWGTEPVMTSADEALTRDEEKGGRSEAEAFLLELLSGGPMPTVAVLAEARKACIAEKTLRRAKAGLGVKVEKIGMEGRWVWHLPVEDNWGAL